MPFKDPEERRAHYREYGRAYYIAHREERKAAVKEYREAHPEKIKALKKDWYERNGREHRAANRDRINAQTAAYKARNPEKNRVWMMRARLKRNYGLTDAEYWAMHEAQNGLCAICGQPETHPGRTGTPVLLAVDHDHRTGVTRALLCQGCNTGVGCFREDPDRLIAAADYIRRFTG